MNTKLLNNYEEKMKNGLRMYYGQFLLQNLI